jgi:transcriptional regulator with XRE-family HTH domain
MEIVEMFQSQQVLGNVRPEKAPLHYISSVQPSKAQFWGAVSLLGALVAGTGGIFDVDNTAQVPNLTNCSIVRLKAAEGEEVFPVTNALSVAERLQQLRDILGLKMSEIADIFGVSRQAAYAWLSGTIPKGEIVRRIWTFSNHAERLRRAGVARPELFTHRPVLQDGRSLFDLLLHGGPFEKAIAVIISTAEKEAGSRSEASMRQSGAFNESKSSSVYMVRPLLEKENG